MITKNKSHVTKHSVTARTKDLRLKGSDLYVARLGSCQVTTSGSTKIRCRASSTAPISPRPSTTSSLHDELSPMSHTTTPPRNVADGSDSNATPAFKVSRPCYRCVTAMHSVGIKRVFWTSHDGKWEGAKVRDLIDALEAGGVCDGKDDIETGQQSKGIFVTKHEVLMLKRRMDHGG